MPFDPDNPIWTAYALGELSDDERTEIEQTLEHSAEARQYIDELRQMTTLLSRGLSSEPAVGLTEIQRAAVLAGQPVTSAAVELASNHEFSKRSHAHLWFQAGAIALVALVAVGLMLPEMQPTRGSGRHVAVLDGEADIQSQKQTELKSESSGLSTKTWAEHAPHHTSSGPQPARPASTEGVKDESREKALPEMKNPRPTIAYTVAKPRYGAESETQPQSDAPAEPANETKARTQSLETTLKKLNQASRPVPAPNDPLGETDAESTTRGIRVGEPTNLNILVDRAPSASVADSRSRPFGTHPLAADEAPVSLALLPDSGINDRPTYPNTEGYDEIVDNSFLHVADNPLSTFSIDVDTASYSNIRRFLTQNQQLPPKGAVRIEEMINYFRYEYPQPVEGQPFSTHVEVAGCPWNAEHRLVKIGLKGREIKTDQRPKSNLVFLLDVSGSMNEPNKLPLVKEAMRMLTGQLTENDRVAIVVYAGGSGLVLPSTTGNNKETIIAALDRLEAGGSTNGAQGIQLAYEIARQNLIKGATNRVILATDGDFNVGITDRTQLIQLIQQEAKSGVFLTTVGFGMGNLKDGTLEQLADKGNGNYAYIDDQREARKVFVEEMSGTLVTIAKDVKIQIEFNPQQVEAFRLIGYENRILAHEDFNDDKKDAGEIGAGHTVTALYELVPKGKAVEAPATDPLKYQQKLAPTEAAGSGELLTLKLRYKLPDADTSTLMQNAVKDAGLRYGQASRDFRFAAGVALFGMLLRDSPHKGTASWDAAVELAQEGVGSDLEGYRIELVELIRAAKQLAQR